MSVVVVLLLLAGLSEAVGRLLPVVSRRPGASEWFVAISLATGTLVEAAVFTSWPWVSELLAARLGGDEVAIEWTSRMVAPLLLSAILAFPLLGPFLHTLLITGVGIRLAQVLHAESDIGWWPALMCVAVAGVGLTAAVTAIRWGVAWAVTPRTRAAVA
ncbi:hypothetical protein OG984_09750 [Nocardioides sp. NBC_00368]|uniref:hypothetical protein n=1 Tax=Nocardioides sp. NBC_00368 TaxID=2976000 RepID=UPI002E23D47C